MATSAGEGTSYQGGAGGKFRKKPFKKTQTTPYDRPTTAFRGNNNSGWVSKMIVGPASKLISASAHLFFSSVRNRILTPTLPPPPPSGSKQESRDRFQEAVLLSPLKDHGQLVDDRGKQGISEDQGHDIKNNGKQMQTTETTGLSELELMLKQNTFSKSEIDRLTALLRSRTVELPNGHGERKSEFIRQETVSTSRGMDYFSRSSFPATRKESPLDNQLPKHKHHGLSVTSKVLEEDVASPAELAKAYMENRSLKISPSMREEDTGVLSGSPFASKSLIRKPTPHNGFLENGFATPKSRGRSAIYTMARTPYPRANPTASHKGDGSIFNPSNGPSASPSTGFARELVARSVSKDLAMKRRSSVLDEEIGSVGPIRRLRQKTNLSTPKNTSSPFSRTPFSRTPFSSNGNGIVSNGALDPSSISKTFQGNEDYNEYMPGTSHTPIPSQSKETANKILQQLQKLTPKEKQFEGKIGALSENSPTKLTPNMLHGQALRSLENVDSSKVFQGADYSLKYTEKKPSSPDVCETSSKGKDKVQENGPKNINISHGSLDPAEISCGMALIKDTVPAFLISEPVKKQTITQSLPKKWGFQMSAHEDFFEFDDELQSSEAVESAKITEDKKISEKPMVETKAVPVTEDKTTSVSEIKALTDSFVFGKPTDFGTSDETKVVEKNNGFLFPAVPVAPAASMCSSPVVSVSQSTKNVNNSPEKEQNVPLLFNSGAENDKKVSSFAFPSSPFLGGSEGLKSAPSVEVKQQNTNSLATNASSTTETVPKPADSDNDVIKNVQKPVDTLEKPANLFSLQEPLSTVGSNHSFSSLTNGSLNSTTPSILSPPSPIIPTTNSENKTLPNPFTGISFLNKNSSAASSEATESTSAAATSSSFLSPIFNFQPTTTTSPTPSLTTTPEIKSNSSFIAPPIYSTVPTISNATDLKTSTEKKELTNPFSSISSPIPATGNGNFGFSSGSNSSSSAAANISQNSIFGTNNSTSSATTQSMPVFGSSSSSSFSSSTSTGFIFGGSGTSTGSTFSSSTSSSFQFGPSTPSKDTVTNPGFGLGTSAPSPSVFSFTAPSSQSSIFGSSTGASTPVFSFNSGPQTNSIFGNNSNNMTMAEDSMAEDSMVHAGSTPTPTLSPPSMPVFGQPIGSNPSPNPFMFGSNPAVSSAGVVPNPFQFDGQQFGGQPVQTGTQIPNPFQQSASGLDLGGGGGGSSFSLGSGGDDKSTRRVIKIKNRVRRK